MKTTKRNGALLTAVALVSAPVVLDAGMTAAEDPVLTAEAVAQMMGLPSETDRKAPVDYGAGPGIRPQVARSRAAPARAAVATESMVRPAIPAGDATASVAGVFGMPIPWPVIPIHVVLLSDGRVMSYGTDASGNQGAQLFYDVWDPGLGTDSNSHFVLANTTGTDIFCSSQSLMLSGDVLTTGGDLTVNGARNSANNNTTIFSSTANALTTNTAMAYARWYPTMLALPNGQLAVFGGRQNVGTLNPVIPATTPEIYDPALRTWTSLTGATSNAAFSANWWYPRAYVAPGGSVFVVNSTNGKMFYLSTAGTGGIRLSAVAAPAGNIALPTIPFAPGKVLAIRQNLAAVVIDYTTSTPVVTPTDPIDQVRFWASGTVLADGRVLVTGGSAVANALTNVAYQAQIWDPRTGHWSAGASATKPRLYHSNAMLLPDASVLTGGGGAPGPVVNLNAEIYYPPYLYASDGTPAARPTLVSTDLSVYDPGSTLYATVGATDSIARLTLVRAGSSTHANNADQRFIELAFTQTGQTLAATLPADTSILVPGYYMLFAINAAGVPSVAKIFSVTTNVPATSFSLSPASVSFGAVSVGSQSAPQSVSVINKGGPLTITGISITGKGASQFSKTDNCSSPIPVGGGCSVNVVFKPDSGGAKAATLNVTGPGISQAASLAGTGTLSVSVSPATVSFGTVAVGTTAATQAVVVTNLSSVPLPISSIALAGTAASQFSQSNDCTAQLPVDGTCTINVTFTPSATGYMWAKVNVNFPGGVQSSKLTGTGG